MLLTYSSQQFTQMFEMVICVYIFVEINIVNEHRLKDHLNVKY